jgi:hypothetical protein
MFSLGAAATLSFNAPHTTKLHAVDVFKAAAPAFTAAAVLAASPMSAFAGDVGAGEQVFSGNCAACHAGGQNVIMPEKTLEVCAPGAGLALPQSRLLPSPRRAVCAPPLAEGGAGGVPGRRLQREVRDEAGALRPPHPTHPMARRSAPTSLSEPASPPSPPTAPLSSTSSWLFTPPTPLARR